MLSLILEPWSYPFMQRALLIAIAVGVMCAIFSCFLILKGWALLGDALSHAVLPGIAVAYLLGWPLYIGAVGGGVLCMGLIQSIHTRVKPDALMGVIFSGLFGFGLVMLSRIESDVHLLHSLFGNILGVSNQDVVATLGVSVLSSGLMLLKRRDLMLHCFDPVYGKTIYLSPYLDAALRIALVLCIVTALKSTGILLVIALLITPGAIGLLLGRSPDQMIGIAVSSTLLASISGVWLSFYLNIATGPFIILIQFILFLIALYYYMQRT